MHFFCSVIHFPVLCCHFNLLPFPPLMVARLARFVLELDQHPADCVNGEIHPVNAQRDETGKEKEILISDVFLLLFRSLPLRSGC